MATLLPRTRSMLAKVYQSSKEGKPQRWKRASSLPLKPLGQQVRGKAREKLYVYIGTLVKALQHFWVRTFRLGRRSDCLCMVEAMVCVAFMEIVALMEIVVG